MPVPAVSPVNWQRTTIVAHLVMATPIDVVETFSFQDQLDSIIDYGEGEYADNARKNEREDAEYAHADFETPYQKKIVVSRDRDHRPHVDKHVAKKLERAVRQENEAVPAEKLDFDNQLRTVLDAAERYYNTLQCEVVVVPKAKA